MSVLLLQITQRHSLKFIKSPEWIYCSSAFTARPLVSSVQFSSVTSLCTRLYTLIGRLHDPANVHFQNVYFEYICLKFAGRLLDRVNIP